MKYNLPRNYLSYSAYNLWKSSRDQYRRRYYLDEDPFESHETRFGNKIGAMVEENRHHDDPVVSQIINYPLKEHKIEVEHQELNLLGYLDQFHDTEFRVLEMKTGHKNKKGKSPWDNVKVRKHKQLVYYSMLVKLKYGQVHPEVILQWLETEFKDDTTEFDGHILKSSTEELILTGRIETYKRVIHDWEIDKMIEDVLLTAEEISNDYTEWKKKN